MSKRSEVVKSLCVGLFTTIFGVFLGFWLTEVYNQPQVEYYSRPYYKLGDFAIGNVYLLNNGKKPDKNIAVTLFTNIESKDIKVVDYTSNYQIKNIDNKTIIVLEELKPQESADITFKADPKEDDCSMDIVSNSGRISDGYKEKWWHFPLTTQILVVMISIVIGIISGFIYKSHFVIEHKNNSLIPISKKK